MDNEDAISISSNDSEGGAFVDRRSILAPAIHDVIAALGGNDGATYKLGDEAYGCLKDLKKLWRKDDTDDERTVARIFWEARVLPNDLVPILLETAGKGHVEDKCAIACADIVTAMTWPIDLAEELKELDDELDKGTDYTTLLLSHLHYKAALLRPVAIQALLGILLPCLAKNKKERRERDTQIINVVLHLFRNLAFIKDPPLNTHLSSDLAEFSSLQSKLIATLSQSHVLDLLLTIASNAATDPYLNQWNTLVLEIFYLLFRGVAPATLAVDQAKRSQGTLSRLLQEENKVKLQHARNTSSRHSRFGTTISVKLKNGKATGTADTSAGLPASQQPRSLVMHHQQALRDDVGSILDLKKRKMAKSTKVDELGRDDNLSHEAKVILHDLAKSFIQTCFNPLLSSLLKDIKSERPKITEKDHLRLLYVTKWFLEFFLECRAQQKTAKAPVWGFEFVGEVLERGWIVWVLKRMREAVEDKPKLWTELQAGIECLTQLLQLIDAMSSTHIENAELNEAAELLQQQLVYNGEVLDISVESLRSYKKGVQSLKYLDSSVRLAYTLLRLLEKWSRGRGNGEVYVRKRSKPKRTRKSKNREGIEEVETEDLGNDADHENDEPIIDETMFTFEAFEIKFANEDIASTLLTYLTRYEEFTSPEQMKRVVSLLHRQAVKAKAEGLFFKVSAMNLFKSILARQSSLPRDQPYRDLTNLITYILKKFFRAVTEDPMLCVEVFFPMNRGRWKKFSTWQPEEKESKRGRDQTENSKHPPDVQVKKGYSWSEQLGIAIACLQENGQQELIDWAKEILTLVIAQRRRIVEETDGSSSQQADDLAEDDEAAREAALKLRQPSAEALAKFEDYLIPYISDEQADAATKNPHMKLVFRLIKCQVLEENADELEWYVPASLLPSDIQSTLNVIRQFETTPIDLGGAAPSSVLTKKRRRRRRRADSDAEVNDGNSDSDADERKTKRTKKAKEKQVYKSAQFIEDSDAEYGDDTAFWARERAQRAKTEALAHAAQDAEGGIYGGRSAGMRSTGTKKRKKRRGRAIDEGGEGGRVKGVDALGEAEAGSDAGVGAGTKATPAPRKRQKRTPASSDSGSAHASDASDSDSGSRVRSTPATTPPHPDVGEGASPVPVSEGKGKGRAPGTKSKYKSKDRGGAIPPQPPARPRPRPRPAYNVHSDKGGPSDGASGGEAQDATATPRGSPPADAGTSSGPLFLADTSASSGPLFLADADASGSDGETSHVATTTAAKRPTRRVLVSDDEEQ